jgi:hypothetical protein
MRVPSSIAKTTRATIARMRSTLSGPAVPSVSGARPRDVIGAVGDVPQEAGLSACPATYRINKETTSLLMLSLSLR